MDRSILEYEYEFEGEIENQRKSDGKHFPRLLKIAIGSAKTGIRLHVSFAGARCMFGIGALLYGFQSCST